MEEAWERDGAVDREREGGRKGCRERGMEWEK